MEKTNRNGVLSKLLAVRFDAFHVEIQDALFQHFVDKQLVICCDFKPASLSFFVS